MDEMIKIGKKEYVKEEVFGVVAHELYKILDVDESEGALQKINKFREMGVPEETLDEIKYEAERLVAVVVNQGFEHVNMIDMDEVTKEEEKNA